MDRSAYHLCLGPETPTASVAVCLLQFDFFITSWLESIYGLHDLDLQNVAALRKTL